MNTLENFVAITKDYNNNSNNIKYTDTQYTLLYTHNIYISIYMV